MQKCNDCIHKSICDADRFAFENCGSYHGHCKDCNDYIKNKVTEAWMCCVTTTSMPEWGYCNFWEAKKE